MFDLEVNLGCIPAGGYTSDWWHQKGMRSELLPCTGKVALCLRSQTHSSLSNVGVYDVESAEMIYCINLHTAVAVSTVCVIDLWPL